MVRRSQLRFVYSYHRKFGNFVYFGTRFQRTRWTNVIAGYISSNVASNGYGTIHALYDGDEVLHVLGLFSCREGDTAFTNGW